MRGRVEEDGYVHAADGGGWIGGEWIARVYFAAAAAAAAALPPT
jgi:hypothetical protein